MTDFSNFTLGAEIEFYLLDLEKCSIADINSGKFPVKPFSIKPDFATQLASFRSEIEQQYNFQTESGAGQFEVNLPPQQKPAALANEILHAKDLISATAKKLKLYASFAAKPIENQAGSGLHIHYCNQLFDPYGLQENAGAMPIQVAPSNNFVLWAIGGLLTKMPDALPLFYSDSADLARFEPWFNAPTKICWGRNNRSTALRVPDSKPKRIEHRVACANVNPLPLLEHIVEAAEFGMREKILPPEPVFGNAWQEQYHFPAIFPKRC